MAGNSIIAKQRTKPADAARSVPCSRRRARRRTAADGSAIKRWRRAEAMAKPSKKAARPARIARCPRRVGGVIAPLLPVRRVRKTRPTGCSSALNLLLPSRFSHDTPPPAQRRPAGSSRGAPESSRSPPGARRWRSSGPDLASQPRRRNVTFCPCNPDA